MGISTLNSVITGRFISEMASSSGSSAPKVGLSKEPEEPLSVTLQRGARGAAASIQSLNSGISYINVAADYTSNMLNVVEALDSLVQKAGKGNIPPSKAKQYKNEFDQLSRAYGELVAGSVVKGRDLLDTTEMAAVLKRGGLDPSKVDELEAAFRKVSSFSGVTVSSNGETTSNAELFPAEEFYRAVRQATRDPEDPPQSDDGSAAFQKIRLAVKEIRRKVESNIESLNVAASLVQKNIELVRATGFALLDASQSVSGDKDAEVLALEIRGAVRSKARGNLSEAHNLNAILAAGLLAVSEKD
jgi:methyl-accepting chemotaxis protein